jgi:hypothetical protein
MAMRPDPTGLDRAPEIPTPQEARQGRADASVLYALIVGLTLAFAAWAIVQVMA